MKSKGALQCNAPLLFMRGWLVLIAALVARIGLVGSSANVF